VALFLSLQLPSTLEYLYIGKQYATVIRPAVRQLNGDDVLVLKSHFPLNYPSLKEAHFYAANLLMKYEKGNVSNSHLKPMICPVLNLRLRRSLEANINACSTLGDALSHHSMTPYH